MAAWMVYAVVVALLVGVSAVLFEQALRLTRRQARLAWLAASAMSVVLPVVVTALPRAPGAGIAVLPGIRVIEAGGANGLGTGGPSLDALITVLWLLASILTVAVVVFTHMRIRREVTALPQAVLDGSAVRIGSDLGPGVVRGCGIVLPAWVLAAPPATRELILRHESEHQRHGDATMLLAGALFIAIMPWNPVLWWQARRLRMAVELDCDRRVLGSGVDPGSYGAMLLDVAQHGRGRVPMAAALLERPSMLARRIANMTRINRRPRIAAGLAVLGVALIVLACEIAGPSAVPQPDADVARVPLRSSGPQFMTMEALRYPPLLRDAGIEGSVVIQFKVRGDGGVDPASVRVVSSDHRAFDRPAVDAIRTARYTPFTGGPLMMRQTIRFVLSGNRPTTDREVLLREHQPDQP